MTLVTDSDGTSPKTEVILKFLDSNLEDQVLHPNKTTKL